MKFDVLKGLLGATFLLTVGVSGVSEAGSGDSEQGMKKFYTCAGCHGISGYANSYPSYHVPRIGGQHAEYVVAALKAYKTNQRKHSSMQANAVSLSDEDMEDIAQYVSKFRSSDSSLPANGDLAKGAEKARQCAACHGDDGNSEDTGFPRLAGQYESYLAKALHDYKSGVRKNGLMAGFAAGLSEDDIADVAAYYASQKRGLTYVKE